jgi:hypothetical protein
MELLGREVTSYKNVVAAFAIGAMAISGCASADKAAPAQTATGSAQVTGSAGATGTSSSPAAADTVTIEQICAAFAPQVDSTQCAKSARHLISDGNADSNQCLVVLQVAAEKAKNNDYSQMQAQIACWVPDDPASHVTVPGSDKIPLNADYKTLG